MNCCNATVHFFDKKSQTLKSLAHNIASELLNSYCFHEVGNYNIMHSHLHKVSFSVCVKRIRTKSSYSCLIVIFLDS